MTNRTKVLVAAPAMLLIGWVWYSITHANRDLEPTDEVARAAPEAVPASGSVPASQPPERIEPAAPLESVSLRSTVAVSAAQPALTFEGALVDYIKKLEWGDGKDWERVISPLKEGMGAINSKNHNPHGKKPSSEQYAQLAALLRSHNELIGPLMVAEAAARKVAHIRAIELGHFDAQVGEATDPFDPVGAKDIMARGMAASKEQYEKVVASRGLRHPDFIHSMVSFTGPDGVPRRTMVWITRQNHPQYFEAQDAWLRAQKKRDEAVKAFFAGL